MYINSPHNLLLISLALCLNNVSLDWDNLLHFILYRPIFPNTVTLNSSWPFDSWHLSGYCILSVPLHYKIENFFKQTLKFLVVQSYGSKTKLRNSNAIPLVNVLKSLNLDSSHFLNAVLNPTICHSKAVVSIGLFCVCFVPFLYNGV